MSVPSRCAALVAMVAACGASAETVPDAEPDATSDGDAMPAEYDAMQEGSFRIDGMAFTLGAPVVVSIDKIGRVLYLMNVADTCAWVFDNDLAPYPGEDLLLILLPFPESGSLEQQQVHADIFGTPGSVDPDVTYRGRADLQWTANQTAGYDIEIQLVFTSREDQSGTTLLPEAEYVDVSVVATDCPPSP